MLKGFINRFLETALRKKPLKPELINILYDLVKIYSPSGQELPVIEYSANVLKQSGFNVGIDRFGNVIADRGKTSPEDKLVCINAHTDTVQKPADANIAKVVFYDWIRDAFHTNNRAMVGGDDKCGIAVALTLAAHTNLPMKIVLTSGEEIGSVGAEGLDRKAFDDVAFTFTVDRMHGEDLISEYCGLVLAPDTFVQKFISLSSEIGVKFVETFGSYADTYILCQYAPAVNLSAGYYNPHTSSDYIKVDETYNTMIAIKNAIDNKADLVLAIDMAPKDWQIDAYSDLGEYGAAFGGGGKYYGNVTYSRSASGGARSRAMGASMGHYGSLSRKERRALPKKCKIEYGKKQGRGVDDKERKRHKLPNPDPDAVASVDELIEAYANGEVYDEEWEALLYDGTLTKSEYRIGIDERIARDRYREDFQEFGDDEPDLGEFKEDGTFKEEWDEDEDDGIDFKSSKQIGRNELADLGFYSGYLHGTSTDDIFVEYVLGNILHGELDKYLKSGFIDEWLYKNCINSRKEFVVSQMPVKPTKVSCTSGGKTLYEWGTVTPPKPHSVSERDALLEEGFISGYPEGAMEDDVFIEYVLGKMSRFELWDNVRDGLPADTARMIEDARDDYLFMLGENKIKNAHKQVDRNIAFLNSKKPITIQAKKSTPMSNQEQKRIAKQLRKSVRDGEHDDGGECRGL